ncbi:MAG TPA: hypothetical protein VF701_05620 [Thermoanaerobaculia bacterium]
MHRLASAFLFTLLFGTGAAAETFTSPPRYVWLTTACPAWNCALSVMVQADGNPHVLALPTRSESYPWLVVRREEAGSVYLPENDPFEVQSFEYMTDAIARFHSIPRQRHPLLVTVVDGAVLVVAMREHGSAGKRRAVAP